MPRKIPLKTVDNTEIDRLGQLVREMSDSQAKLIREHELMRRQLNVASRNYFSLLSAVNMPQLHLDPEWRIVGYTGNFSLLLPDVAELSAKRMDLREILCEGDFKNIEDYVNKVEVLKSLPYEDNASPWELEYEGPGPGEKIGRDWLVSNACSLSHWRIEKRPEETVLLHSPHITDKVDCYLMHTSEFNRTDRDLKIIYRVHTSHDPGEIRDLSLVIGGSLGRDENLCDLLGYTVCTGSLANTMSRIQRETADCVMLEESLEPDTDYEITAERIGGRITRRMINLRSGAESPPLVTIDPFAIYNRSPYIGFTTFSGQAMFYGLRVYIRKSKFKLNRFRIPFDVEVGLKGLKGRRFKLRMGEEYRDGLRRSLLFEDVTERRRSEEKIRFNEEKFRALFEMESDALFLISNVDGHILETNPAAEKMYGYSRSEMRGMQNTNLSAEPDATRKATIGYITSIPLRWHRSKDGTVFPVEITARHFNWRGVSVHLAAIRRISERLEAEQKLKEQKEFLQQVIDLNPNIIFVLDSKGCNILVNKAYQNFHGLEFESVRGRRPDQYMPNKKLGRYMTRLNEEILTGRSQRINQEIELLDRSGESRWIHTSIVPVLDESGKVMRIIGVSADITGIKQSAEALSRSEKRFRNLFEQSNDAVFIHDLDWRLLDLNPKAVDLLGYSRDELLEMSMLEFHPESERKKALKAIQKLCRDGAIVLEAQFQHKSGALIDVEISSRVIDPQECTVQAVARDISERKQAEAALRESERKYRTLFDTSSEALAIFEVESLRYVDVNRAALDLYGYSWKELTSLTPLELSSDRTMTERNLARLFEKGAVNRLEIVQVRKDGLKIPVEIYASVFEVEGRRYVMVQARDITERKQSEKALRDSEARSRAMLEAIPDLIFRIDFEGRVLDFSGPSDELFRPVETFIGKSLRENLPTALADYSLSFVSKALQSSRLQHFVYELPMDGEVRHYECRMVAIDSREVLAIIRDITERNRAEEQLAQAHVELDQIFNSTNPILVLNLDHTVIRVNQSWLEKFGYREEEILGNHCDGLWHGVRCNTDACPLEVMKAGRERCELELESKSSDGRSIPCILTATPLRRPDGELIGIVESFKDISELRLLEQERLRSDKLESVGLLAGGIAHDFNNILTAILGNASLAKMMIHPDDQVFEPLGQIEKSSLRARELTQQLLTFSRGGQPIKRAASLEDLVREAVEFSLSGSNVTYDLLARPNLWPVDVDPGQVNQVLNNLIINADQAMPQGGLIRIGMANCRVIEGQYPGLAAGRYVKLTIQDNGIGIHPDHLSRIFDPYFTTKQKGSGLGLATAYSIIRRHGGYISVESELHEGTTFSLWLPVSKSGPDQKMKSEPALPRGGSHILVMDDEDVVRRVLHEMLRQLGYEAEITSDGAEAVKLYAKRLSEGHPFDAVIMDLTVPGGMGGLEALQKLLKLDPNVRAVVSSGYSNEEVMSEYRKHGFLGVVAKPYRMEELRETVAQVLTRRPETDGGKPA